MGAAYVKLGLSGTVDFLAWRTPIAHVDKLRFGVDCKVTANTFLGGPPTAGAQLAVLFWSAGLRTPLKRLASGS